MAKGHEELLNGVDVAAVTEEIENHSFEIDPSEVHCIFLTISQ